MYQDKPLLFIYSSLLIVITALIVILIRRNKKTCRKLYHDKELTTIHSIFNSTSQVFLKNTVLRNVYDDARSRYESIEDARKGAITALKKGNMVLFYLYVRHKDGSITKQIITPKGSIIKSYPEQFQHQLSEEEEVLIAELN